MDQRQQQIREGAGLEESRINEEFVAFLQKWSTPVLVLLLVAVLGYRGWMYLEEKEQERIDDAFGQYEAVRAGGSPSPDALKQLAADFEGVKSVSLLAQTEAADLYLQAIQTGMVLGAETPPFGQPVPETDRLGDEQRAEYLDKAEGIYRSIWDATSDSAGKALFALQAGYGLAATAECRGDFDQAKQHYERVADLAARRAFSGHAKVARERAASAESLATAPGLMPNDAVREDPGLTATSSTTLPPVEVQDAGILAPAQAMQPGTGQAPASAPASTPGSAPAQPAGEELVIEEVPFEELALPGTQPAADPADEPKPSADPD